MTILYVDYDQIPTGRLCKGLFLAFCGESSSGWGDAVIHGYLEAEI